MPSPTAFGGSRRRAPSSPASATRHVPYAGGEKESLLAALGRHRDVVL